MIDIENKIINGEKEGDSGRWTQSMSTIFEIDNQLYCIDWECGLTEYQDNEYWEQPYKVKRVEKEVTTTVVNYVAMED